MATRTKCISVTASFRQVREWNWSHLHWPWLRVASYLPWHWSGNSVPVKYCQTIQRRWIWSEIARRPHHHRVRNTTSLKRINKIHPGCRNKRFLLTTFISDTWCLVTHPRNIATNTKYITVINILLVKLAIAAGGQISYETRIPQLQISNIRIDHDDVSRKSSQIHVLGVNGQQIGTSDGGRGTLEINSTFEQTTTELETYNTCYAEISHSFEWLVGLICLSVGRIYVIDLLWIFLPCLPTASPSGTNRYNRRPLPFSTVIPVLTRISGTTNVFIGITSPVMIGSVSSGSLASASSGSTCHIGGKCWIINNKSLSRDSMALLAAVHLHRYWCFLPFANFRHWV